MSLADLGEFGLIERLRHQASEAPDVRIGIGDDCAAVEVSPGELLLVTSDLLLEGIHFRLDWTSLHDLGSKAVAVNLSDIAAMGGQPRFLVLGLGLPPELPLADLDLFLEGFLSAAAAAGVTLVGGDTCRSEQFLSIAVTAHGTIAPEQMIRRSGARSGDLLYVSGCLGDAALALRQLQAGLQPHPELAEALHCPRAQLALGRALAQNGLASSMIDLSDGLLADLGHLLKESRLGAEIEPTQIPLSRAFAAAQAVDPSLLDLALTGGEDYHLLFSSSPERAGQVESQGQRLGLDLRCIGRLHDDAGRLEQRLPDGRLQSLDASGFRHF